MGKQDYRPPQPTQASPSPQANDKISFLDRAAITLFPSYATMGMKADQAAKAAYDAAEALLEERTSRA